MSEYTNDVHVMLDAIDGTAHTDTHLDTATSNDDDIHNDTNITHVNNTSNDDVKIDDVKIDEDIKHKDDESVKVDSEADIKDIDMDSLMLSTVDNPYNPKEEYELWQRWDNDNGHHTEAYIARLVTMDEDFNADDDDEFMLNMITSKVIDDILANDSLQIYRLV